MSLFDNEEKQIRKSLVNKKSDVAIFTLSMYRSLINGCISLVRPNGNIISDPVITANLLNTHFCNIHQTVAVDKTFTYTPSDSS